MNKKQLNALKRKATKHLLSGLAMIIIATIPVMLKINADHTGSVFCWGIAGIVVYDSIIRLIKLNRIG